MPRPDKDQTPVGVELIAIPEEKDYEEYICAHLQASGLFVDKSMIYRGEEELLELDIIVSKLEYSDIENILIEIKSRKWGFSEIFKVKGWMSYLGYTKGCFIVQNTRPSFKYFEERAQEMNVTLIDNSKLEETNEALSSFYIRKPLEEEVATLRYCYLLERKKFKEVKALKRDNEAMESYKALDDYIFKVTGGTFFSSSPTRRVNQLFNYYIKYKNITSKICNELSGGNFSDEVTQLSRECFQSSFYHCEDNIYQTSLFVEHINRLTILKCCVEQIIHVHRGSYDKDNFWNKLTYLELPGTIKRGLQEISAEPYFHLYPVFWQYFTYVFGGFILNDIRDKEYKTLSDRTGIPVDHIQNALDSFNKLFPRDDGWSKCLRNSNITFHNLFPASFRGIGVNHRKSIYTPNKKLDELKDLVTGQMTFKDMMKWNDLAYRILK